MNSRTHFAPLRLCGRSFLLLALVGLSIVNVRSQTNLVQVRWPDLTNLEESVREQITELQNSLAVTAKNPASSETALSEAYGKLGQTYHAYYLVEPARDCYLNASLLAPRDFRWTYLVAKLDQQQGSFDDAIRRYRTARTLRPDYVAVPVNLGNIFLELNRLDEAKESFSDALQLDTNNPAAHYGLGQVALSSRSYAEAIRHFDATLAQVPSANRVHYSLAMAYRGLGDVEKMKAHLAQQGSVGVRVADPLIDSLQDLIGGERVHLARGKLALEAKRYAEAAVEFRKAIAVSPNNVAARINLGVTLSQLGDTQGATEQFEEALRIEPGKFNAHYNLAILLAGQNQHEKAITHLRSALAVEPGDASVRFMLGTELVKVGRLDDALEQVKILQRAGQVRQALDLAQRVHAATVSPQPKE
jgi:tetratricopeptide (TPR) repeat protein